MKIFKRILIFLSIVIILVGATFGIIGYSLCTSALHEEPLATKIKSIQEKDTYVKLENLPKNYLDAVVSVEDRRFYKHGAIDIISIGRAVLTNIKEKNLVEGGSTLTQQLAKNLYFTYKAEVTRKAAELFMAFTIEDNYSKDEILELYVNTCYFGAGYYGIKDACMGYFNKEPKDMDLNESSLIAGIPNAPSVYGLNNRPDLAKKRQKHILKSMVKNKYITQEEADKVLNSKD